MTTLGQGANRWVNPLKWWGDHPWPDFVVAALIALISFTHVIHQPSVPDRGQRLDIYSSAGNIVAVVGGLAGIAVSAYLAMSGARARALRAGAGPALTRNWVETTLATALSALACWSAQVADVTHGARLAWSIAFGGVAWCVITSVRQAWLLRLLLRVAAADDASPPRADSVPAPEPSLGPIPSQGPPPEEDGSADDDPDRGRQLRL